MWALAKHWVGYGVSEDGINCATINTGKKDMFEVYATLFAAAIKEEFSLFDYPYVDPEEAVKVFVDPKSDALSQEMAEKSMILLRNENHTLALSQRLKDICVVGPFSQRMSSMYGGYAYSCNTTGFLGQLVDPTVNRPIKELRAWKRVHLEPGEKKWIEFTLDTRNFGYFNAKSEFMIEARPQEIYRTGQRNPTQSSLRL